MFDCPVSVLLNDRKNLDKKPNFFSYYCRHYQSPPKSKIVRVGRKYILRCAPFKIFPDAPASICSRLSGPFTLRLLAARLAIILHSDS